MPRPKKPARLYQRPDTGEWIIRDGQKTKRTGCFGPEGEHEADRKLTLYKAKKEGLISEATPPEQVPVLAVLKRYANNLPSNIVETDRVLYAIQPLMLWWGGMMCAEIDDESCEKYIAWRQDGGFRREMIKIDPETKARKKASRATARRELVVMKSALKASKGKLLTHVPDFKLPHVKQKKVQALSRNQFAALLWELWAGQYDAGSGGKTKRSKRTQPQARLALAQFYTGSRPATVSKSTWEETPDGPWIDLEAMIWYRAGDDEEETNKRREPHKIPSKLGAHLRRWKRLYGGTYIAETARDPGEPILDIGGSLESAAERAGVPRITPHVLKHTAISNFLRSSGTREEAADYFSTSWETINSVYWTKSPEFQQSAADKIDRLGKRTDMHRKS